MMEGVTRIIIAIAGLKAAGRRTLAAKDGEDDENYKMDADKFLHFYFPQRLRTLEK